MTEGTKMPNEEKINYTTIRIPEKIHLMMKAISDEEGMKFSIFTYRLLSKALAKFYPDKIEMSKTNDVYLKVDTPEKHL